MKKSFTPFENGFLKWKNHLVIASMTGSRAIDNLPNKRMATYYAHHSDAGLIVTEGNSQVFKGLVIPGFLEFIQKHRWRFYAFKSIRFLFKSII